MRKQAYTLAEVLVTAFIMSVVLTFLAMVLWVGDQTYKRNMGLIDLHTQARRVMDGMTREIRKGSNFSDLSGSVSSIQFDIPKNVTRIGSEVKFNNETVRYYLSNSDHAIRRAIVPSGPDVIVATDIDTDGLVFCGSTSSSACPCVSGCNDLSSKVVRIEMRGNRTIRGGDLIFNTVEQVRVRNE
ncbi:MAG: hypothetical protein ABH865_07035 [Candidatus Omnitrophota bacterium]|nr:hypothetical protein [Candidatus Omnitrophota bacterium]